MQLYFFNQNYYDHAEYTNVVDRWTDERTDDLGLL